MKQKHTYFIALTPWSNEKQTEHGYIVWYKIGGRVRGGGQFSIFNTLAEAQSFADSLIH